MTFEVDNTNFTSLRDRFGRIHTSVRVSVTDRCNIRCFYCMPEKVQFMPRKEVLSYEEIVRVISILARLGINQVRITGGEPLVRSNIWKLIQQIRSIGMIEDIGLTTNGLLLANQAHQLKQAGLDRINVSLDSVDPKSFQEITRRDGLEKVLRGIEMAKRVGFDRIRINAVSIKGRTESEIVPLAIFCRKHRLELRFIEFMPLDGDGNWLADQVLSGKQVLDLISQEVAPLTRVYRHDPSQPATDYEYPGGERVGFINSVTEPFCESCNRLRMTAEGRLRNCLFANQEWDVRHLVRNGHDDAEIVDLIQACVAAKKLGHGSNNGNFVRPERAMYQIGG